MPLGLGAPFVAESGVVTDTVRPLYRVVAVGRGMGTVVVITHFSLIVRVGLSLRVAHNGAGLV